MNADTAIEIIDTDDEEDKNTDVARPLLSEMMPESSPALQLEEKRSVPEHLGLERAATCLQENNQAPSASSNNVSPPASKNTSSFPQLDRTQVHATPVATPSPPPARPKKRYKQAKTHRLQLTLPALRKTPRSPPTLIVHPNSNAFPKYLDPATIRFIPASWPNHVVSLRANFNPDAITLPLIQSEGSCVCDEPCRRETCMNAMLGLYCVPSRCAQKAKCGNALTLLESVVLAKDTVAKILTVVATAPIPCGVIVGEYLGRLTLEPPLKHRIRNRGYRLLMKHAPKHSGQWKACIDADVFGSLMRFVNHSCEPTCAFFHLANGLHHTMVVVTTQKVLSGQEITVDYGNEIWFICRCGRESCQHRDVQDLDDPQGQ